MTVAKNVAVALAIFVNLLLLSAIAAAQTPITIEGDRIFPESLDAGSDGTLYIGSVGKGAIFKAAPNATTAIQWIEKAANKISAVTGVVVDEARSKLWVCSTDLNRIGEPVSLKVFNLDSGMLKGDYPFPENKGLCNDIVIAKDGTAFVTDTNGARIFRLKLGGTALEQWVVDPRFEGIDGIAFGPGGDILINNVRTNLLFRIALKEDGSPGAIAQVMTSRPLEGPDGMRPTGDGRFVFTENRGGRVSIGTLDGNILQIETLKEGLQNPPGVTVFGKTIWFVEMKSKYRNDPNFMDKDPGPFQVTPIPLPAK